MTRQALLIGPLATPAMIRSTEFRRIHAKADVRVGVDGGLGLANLVGLPLDIAVGDWDSLAERFSKAQIKKLLNSIPHVTLPKKKSMSDFGVALRGLETVSEVHAWGFLGERRDHEYGVLLESVNWLNHSNQGVKRSQVNLYDSLDRWILLRGPGTLRLKGIKGRHLSTFAMQGPVEDFSIKGARYELAKECLKPGSQGLSNFFEKNSVDLELRSGCLGVYLGQ